MMRCIDDLELKYEMDRAMDHIVMARGAWLKDRDGQAAIKLMQMAESCLDACYIYIVSQMGEADV